MKDERIVADKASEHPNSVEFSENRHDQTVLSLLRYKWSFQIYPPPNDFLRNIRIASNYKWLEFWNYFL